jgi:HflC protein
MSNRSYLAVIILGFLALVVSMAAFTVRETDLAIKFRFGEIVRADYEPGLHFMMPLVNNVRKFDRRILTEDYPAEQFLTSEGKILRIDFFVKWRITDVSRFYTSTAGGSEDVANRRLGEIVKDGIKGVIAKRTIQQVVAAERTEFLSEVRQVAEGNVAGLGNIYVCEALYRARISPLVAAGKVSKPRLETLAAVVRDVLNEAILAGGSTLKDFANADGGQGYFQHRFDVYGREGQPCLADGCSGVIRRTVQGGRSTFWCPVCQRR